MRCSLKIILTLCLMVAASWAFCQTSENSQPAGAAPGSTSPTVVSTPADIPPPPGVKPESITNPGNNQPQPNAKSEQKPEPKPESKKEEAPNGSGGYNRQSNRGSGATYSMSFDKADAQSVVKFFSMSSRIPIVVDPDLKGNITVLCSDKLSLADMYEVINAALRVRGFTMVGNLDSKVIRVIPLKKAITDSTGVASGKELKAGVIDGDMITQVIPLDFADANKLMTELKPLVSADQASIVSISSTNTLVITDNTSNVRKMMEIIKYMDKDSLGVIEVEVYQCRYSSADSLVNTLNTLFQSRTTNRRGQTPGAPPGTPGGQGGPQGANVPSGPDNGLNNLRGTIDFAADARTNRIIITGSRERIDTVLTLVKELDVDTEPEVKVKFIPLQYADAKTVADQLNNLFEQPQGRAGNQRGGGFNPFFGGGGMGGQQNQTTAYPGLKRNLVVADIRTNSVIITATEQNMRSFESMVKELDAPKVLSEITRVYPLAFAKANELANTLNQLFRGGGSRGGRSSYGIEAIFGLGSSSTNTGPLAQLREITVVAETKTNSLLVTGPPNSASLMDDLIKQLDKRTEQVFIEVAIVDVTLDDDTKFGIEWQWNQVDTRPSGEQIIQTAGTDFGLAKEVLGFKYSVLSQNLSALLHALKTRSNVKVLSTPTITTSDNVEAKISIGQDQPFVSSETETSGGNFRRTVDFKKVAIALTVTPHVNGSSDVIALDVHQTINEIIGREPELGAPIIADREAITSISVADGQTIVIGGIIKENRDKITKAVPILSSIPLIGELFKSRENRVQKSELMVFLTPHILKNEQDVTGITDLTRSKLSLQPPDGIITGNKDAEASK